MNTPWNLSQVARRQLALAVTMCMRAGLAALQLQGAIEKVGVLVLVIVLVITSLAMDVHLGIDSETQHVHIVLAYPLWARQATLYLELSGITHQT